MTESFLFVIFMPKEKKNFHGQYFSGLYAYCRIIHVEICIIVYVVFYETYAKIRNLFAFEDLYFPSLYISITIRPI